MSLRWGVLGVSEFARRSVLPVLHTSHGSELVAIASRDPARAAAEARRFRGAKPYDSYDALLADPSVDAVYLPLPNSLHHDWALKAFTSGKHVLCEKPLARTANEAAAIVAAAQSAGRVLLEGYMSAFHPRQQLLVATASSGGLGRLRSMRGVFTGKRVDYDNYRWRPELGGGALLDLGIYCIEPMVAIAGEPLRVSARQVIDRDVDTTFEGWLEFADGSTGSFLVSFEMPEAQSLEVIGTDGRVRLDPAFTAGKRESSFVIERPWGKRQRVATGGLNSYAAMVAHFEALVAGAAAGPGTPEASVATLTLLDRLRAAAGA